MPLSKYHIRNEYGMADPELYRAADRDDPEALLEAVAMSGLVGILRQLGDLAEFAAEIFHDLHEEVMATAARGHGLMTRVQQLEAEVPSLEKAFFSLTHHSSFFTNAGVDWHPNLRSEQNLVTQGDLPRFVMDSYEECRGPPRLFLLDKFDVAGAGACLKRYTDPSFFKESASFGIAAEVHREKRVRKVKKRGARLRDGEGPNVVQTHAKLHQLLLEERIENGYTDPARLVKLKKRQLNGSAVESKSGISYMAKFMETPSPDPKMIYETSIIPLPVKSTLDDTSEPGIKTLEISCISPVKKTSGNKSPNEQESELKAFSEMDGKANGDFVKVKEQISAGVAEEISSNHPEYPAETDLEVDKQKKIGGILNGYHSDDVTSEVDNYMDALTTMESELETDNECKPKNNLLNIQKVTDAHDKIEHQEDHGLESRFLYSQSFGASSTSDEQDRNEEHIEAQAQLSDSQSVGTSTSDNNNSFRRDGEGHIEMQAHFSDSQSVGNSSISDDNSSFKKDRSYFHHSDDSSSSVVENIQLEPISFTNTKYYEPGVEEYTPSNQLPQIVEFQHSDHGKFVAHDDAHVQEDEASDSGRASHDDTLVQEDEVSDSGQASFDLVTSGGVLNTDLGPASPLAESAGTQSIETPSDPVELRLRLEDDESRTSFVESITAKPISLSILKDDAYPVDSSDKNSLDNLDGSDPHVQSEDSVHVSNQFELTHENSDHSEKFEEESAKENSCESLADGDMGSAGVDPIPSSMEEVDLNSGIKVALDSQNSKEEESIKAAQLSLKDLTPAAEIPQVSSLGGELSSDSTNNPQDEPSSTESEVLCSEERPEMVHDDETRSTCSDDPVKDDGLFKHLSSSDNHVIVRDMVTVDVQSEDQALLTVPSVSAEKDVGIVTRVDSDLIFSSSRSIQDLQEPLSGSSNSYLVEKESIEAELPQISMDLNAEKRENQQESLLDMSSFDIGCSPTNDCTKMKESLSPVGDPHEKEMEVNDAVSGELLTELEEQKIVDHSEIASAGVQLNLKESVASDFSDSERCNNIESSSPREKFQHNAFVDNLETVPDFSGLDSQQSESIVHGQNNPLRNGRDGFSSPPCNQLQSETDLQLFSQSQAGEVDTEFLPIGEEDLTSGKFESQQMEAHQLEQESNHATSEFASEFHADESSSHSLPQSYGQEVNTTKPVMDPLKPLFPDLVPKTTVNNLDEMPPMPPLPPMQWRMGKVQHSSLVSQREDVEVSQASFQLMLPSVQPIPPTIPDRKPQFGLPTSERETLMYQNPFVSVMAMESDKLQHSSGFPIGVSGHPVAIPFQFPIMVNEAKGQYNYVVLDRSQIQNPFLTLPMVTTGRPPHGYIVASEGENAQNSNLYPPMPASECSVSVNDSTSLQEKMTQPPSQLMTDTFSEVKTIEQSVSNVVSMDRTPDVHLAVSEGEMVPTSSTCPPIPHEECAVSGQDSTFPQEEPNQPQLKSVTSLEDITLLQSTSNLASTGGPAECAVSDDDSISPQEKPTNPSNQIMTEVNNDVKPLHLSKINAEGGQENPSFSLMLPPNMESMEPNQRFLYSEGETAFSLDASAQSSDFDGERINGKPKTKLPRPRNPLIDAVAAHDKSKLRRVTERVIPEAAPKVDERDSLLEQIRTKSFNLKPTVSTRPSVQGPKTNLKLAAILEKANAIRQALAGSDEDDDADSWSDS